MKNYLAVPKLLYAFRTAPTFFAPELLEGIENSLRALLEDVLNTSLNDMRWSQACLPSRDGGLGIPSPKAIAACAYLASVHSSTLLSSNILGSKELFSHANEASLYWTQTDPPSDPTRQKLWFQPIADCQWNKLL